MFLSKYWWQGKGGREALWGLAPKDITMAEVITMAEPFSIERRKLMRFLGAKVGGSDAVMLRPFPEVKAIQFSL